MTEAPLSRARSRAVVLVLACAAMVSSLQFTLMVPVLADVPDALGVSASDAAWLIIATLLSSTVSTPIVSRMADLYGRRRMMLVSLGLLCAGSVLAAVGMTFTTVIIGRVLQGFATSVVPIGISLIHTHVDRRQANMGVALLSGTIGMGSTLGLPLSGLLMSHGGLSGIFWSSAVASAAFMILVRVIVPEAPDRLSKRFDPFGALLLVGWLTALTLVISKGAEWGWVSIPTLAWTGGGLLAFGIWIAASLRNDAAVIDLRLAMQPTMLRINAASFLATFGMFANHLITMQEARAPEATGIGMALPVSVAGLLLLPFALTMMALTPVTGWCLNRYGARFVLGAGAGVMALGFAFRTFVHGGLATVIVGTLIVGAGTAFAFASMPALVSQASPPEELASANGVNALIRSFSGAIASSAFAFALVAFPSAIDPQFLSEQGLMLAFGAVALGCLAAAVIAAAPIRRTR